MKYTFTIVSGGDNNERREKVVLQSRAGESDRHIALKILAYLLYRDDTNGLPLRIEQGVGQRHKPDLVATDPETGRVLLWIDCGQIEVKRLGRIAQGNPHARVIIVKATCGEADNYARAAARHLPPPDRGAPVTYLGFDEAFFEGFRERMRGTNDVGLFREGKGAPANSDDGATPAISLHVVLNGEAWRTPLYQEPAPFLSVNR